MRTIASGKWKLHLGERRASLPVGGQERTNCESARGDFLAFGLTD